MRLLHVCSTVAFPLQDVASCDMSPPEVFAIPRDSKGKERSPTGQGQDGGGLNAEKVVHEGNTSYGALTRSSLVVVLRPDVLCP